MHDSRFDLVVIFQEIFRKTKFILLFAVGATVIGLVCCLFQTKKYESQTVFIVKSPEVMDRNQMFRLGDYQKKEFFASETEIDNVMTISQNDILIDYLVDSFNLMQHYGSKDLAKARKELKSNLNVKRYDTRSIELRILDKDPNLAAKMVSTATDKIESTFKNFFAQTNKEMLESLRENIRRIDTEIRHIDDSIRSIRNQYGLYDQLIPLRSGAIVNAKSINAEQARGMELLQGATSIKDQFLKDRSSYFSLINEYQVGLQSGALNLLYVVQHPWPSDVPATPNIPLILGICFIGGLGFSAILVLIKSYSAHRADTIE